LPPAPGRSTGLSLAEQASLNLEQARALRASGLSYREIGRQLRITSSQLSNVRRALKREKGAATRLRRKQPDASDRDLPISQSVLPPGLRKTLIKSGYRTLGDLADRLADPEAPALETVPGIGPHRAQLVRRLLDHFGLRPGASDLQAAIEHIFPELGDAPPTGGHDED
jgi:hypothetical protein